MCKLWHIGFTSEASTLTFSFFSAEVGMSATTDHLFTSQPPMSTIYSLDSSTIKDSQGNNSTEKRVTAALNHTGSVSYNSSHVSTSPAPNSTAESPRPTTPCCKKYSFICFESKTNSNIIQCKVVGVFKRRTYWTNYCNFVSYSVKSDTN